MHDNKTESLGVFCGIVGKSKAIKKIFDLIRKVSETDSSVLITGESGTGKELVAKAIHTLSLRQNERFVTVNCGAIPEGLMESELFGHEKGAFTGSIKTRIGKFEASDKGTMFLDEIAEMGYPMQVKLLRVLQEREIERVGASDIINIDTRVIAATNKNLEEEIENKNFREDLYYRLNVIPISIPPLRDRHDDILLLVNFFLDYFNKSKEKKIESISPEALSCLSAYSWPGNVRELENIMERMVVLSCGNTINKDDLPDKILKNISLKTVEKGKVSISVSFDDTFESLPGIADLRLPEKGLVLKEVVSEIEKKLIIDALGRNKWIKNKAAKVLGLNRTTLVEKMKKLQISGKENND